MISFEIGVFPPMEPPPGTWKNLTYALDVLASIWSWHQRVAPFNQPVAPTKLPLGYNGNAVWARTSVSIAKVYC